MKYFGAGFISLSMLVLCGCQSTHTRPPPEPITATFRGAYVHAPSMIQMPEAIAGFQRGNITGYDAVGADVSAGYNLVMPNRRVTATVYVYPSAPMTAEQEFERRKQEIQQVHAGATLLDQREFSRKENGQSYSGKMAVFEFEDMFAGARTRLRSRLYLFSYVDGKWTVKYRFTYPKSEEAEDAIDDFIREWRWYGRGA